MLMQGKLGKSLDLHRLDVWWRGKYQKVKLNTEK
jgi:hypothetical protein